MQVEPLAIEGLWEITPVLRPDDRGVFLEAFKADVLSKAIGHPFTLKQMNVSVSSAGTVRGIHFADVPVGQAKYVQCFSGAILDVVVDIRVGSPTFGQWDAVELNSTSRKALYISEGLGHAFCALTDDATVGYLCSEPYSPTREHGIHPLDSTLARTRSSPSWWSRRRSEWPQSAHRQPTSTSWAPEVSPVWAPEGSGWRSVHTRIP